MGWSETNKYYQFFEFTIIIFVRPEKKSPNQFTGFYVQFDFHNKTVKYTVGEANKLNPPPIGVLFEGDLPEWEESFKIRNFKPIKFRKKILLNSAENMQLTMAGMDTKILQIFVTVIYRSMLELNILSEYVKPSEPLSYEIKIIEGSNSTEPEIDANESPLGNDEKRCANCGAASKISFKFCMKCGTKFPN